MRFGFAVPNRWGIEDVGALFDLGQQAEGLGFDSLWASEHQFHAGALPETTGNGPIFEPLTMLAYLAAVTKSVRLGPSVMILPYHHPVILAKAIATLDVISGGRLNLGVGVGGVPEEFAGLGVKLTDRGAMADEAIDAMKILWSEESPSFEGRYHSFSGLGFSPKPVQKPHPPIFVGGHSKAAIRRAARVGAWWHPGPIQPDLVRWGVNYLTEQARVFGRDPSEIGVSLKLYLDIPSISGVPRLSSHTGGFIGTIHGLLQRLWDYRDAGVHHILVATMSRDVEVIKKTMEFIAIDIMPEFNR